MLPNRPEIFSENARFISASTPSVWPTCQSATARWAAGMRIPKRFETGFVEDRIAELIWRFLTEQAFGEEAVKRRLLSPPRRSGGT